MAAGLLPELVHGFERIELAVAEAPDDARNMERTATTVSMKVRFVVLRSDWLPAAGAKIPCRFPVDLNKNIRTARVWGAAGLNPRKGSGGP